jgi:dienelactone hydrolase
MHEREPPAGEAGFPAPTGPHAVGRVNFDLVDRDREDPYARRGGAPRRLAVWVWYPAAPRTGASPGAYLPGVWRTTSWLWGLHASRVRAHAREAADPAEGAFPLILFSPSVNPPLCYTALLQELASHGYIAAGISHTYESIPLTVFADAPPRLARLASLGGALAAPGKRPYEQDLRERADVVAVKAADLEFVRARLGAGDPTEAKRLRAIDPARSAVIGHSFGGGAAADICQRQDPPTAGVSFDGGLWRAPDSLSPTGPFLQLFGEHPEYTTSSDDSVRRGFFKRPDYAEQDRATTVGAWQALHSRASPGYSAVVRGAAHTSFCDWPMLPLRTWSPARRALRGLTGAGVWNAVTGALLMFLGKHVRGDEGDVLATMIAADALRVGEPAKLFPPDPLASA